MGGSVTGGSSGAVVGPGVSGGVGSAKSSVPSSVSVIASTVGWPFGALSGICDGARLLVTLVAEERRQHPLGILVRLILLDREAAEVLPFRFRYVHVSGAVPHCFKKNRRTSHEIGAIHALHVD